MDLDKSATECGTFLFGEEGEMVGGNLGQKFCGRILSNFVTKGRWGSL